MPPRYSSLKTFTACLLSYFIAMNGEALAGSGKTARAESQTRVRLKGQISEHCELTTKEYKAVAGGLTAGTLGFDVDCNTGATITVRAKHGVLTLNKAGATPVTVAYDTGLFIYSLGDKPLLSAPGEKLMGPGVTEGAGGAVAYKSAGKLEVTPHAPTSPGEIPAGMYTDQVTITITPQGT